MQHARVLEVGLDPCGEGRGGDGDAVDDRVLERVALLAQDVGHRVADLVRVRFGLGPGLGVGRVVTLSLTLTLVLTLTLDPNPNPSPNPDLRGDLARVEVDELVLDALVAEEPG